MTVALDALRRYDVAHQGYAGRFLRAGAPPFYGPGGPAVVVYDQPGWYNPWLWYDGRWIYRPYPYHRYWHDHYRR